MTEFTQVIYINGLERMATKLSTRFFVDDPELPRRKCSFHMLNPESVSYLKSGGAVYTSGNVYSLRPNPY